MKKLSLKRMLSLILAVCLMVSLTGVMSLTAAASTTLNYVEEFDTVANPWSQFKKTYPGWSLSFDESKISEIANATQDPRVKTAGIFQFSTKKDATLDNERITKTFDSNCTDNEIVFETKVKASSGNSPRRTALTINGAGGTLARLNFVENQKFSYNTDATNTTAITTDTKWHTDYIVIKIVISKSNPGENNPYDTCYYYIGDLEKPAAGGTNHMVNKTLTSVNGFSLVWRSTGTSILEMYYDYFKMSSSKGSLATPAKPVWGSNDKTLSWNAVENADSYDIYLLRDGVAVDTYKTSATSYVFSSVMTENGNGSYTAQIVAKSSAGYKDSNKSSLSDAYVFADIPLEPLATPSAPSWGSTETTLNWNKANNASGYEVKLYKDDVEGDILVATVSVQNTTTYNFKDEMLKNGSGSYLAKIKALGDSLTCDDSEYSSASALSAFDVERYRKVNYVLDFEVPNFSLGDLKGQNNVQHSNSTAPSNWTAKVVDEETVKSIVGDNGTSRALELKSDLDSTVAPDGDIKIMFDSNAFNSNAVSVSGRVYLSSYDDRVKLTLLKTAGSAVSQILFAQGRFAYRNSAGEKFFLNNNKLSAGWHDFEIRMFKDTTGCFTSAKYFLDGTECLPQNANDTIWVNSNAYIGGIWLQCLKTEGTHTLFDDITVSSFDGENRASASVVTSAQWNGKTLKWTPADNDNAVSYIVRLYKNDEVFSTVHVLPEDADNGVDFSNKLVYDQDITYTATVQTKGDYSTYISSAESTPVAYKFDVDVSEFRVYDTQGNPIKDNFYGDSLTLKVAINEGKAVNADMFLAYFNGTQLVSVGAKEINIASNAQVRTDSLVLSVPNEDVTHVKAFLFEKTTLKPILAPIVLTPDENLVMPVIFNDNMVLQRNEDVAIWGKAPKGRTVTVEFAGQTLTDVADSNGDWEVALAPMSANEVGQDLTVSTSKDAVTYSNVVVGDVWMVTGQSNAEWVMKNFSDTAEDIENANLPQIRYMKPTYTAANATASEELDEYSALIKTNWTPISPDMAKDVGAVSFYFAKHLQPEAGVPIGIINNAKSGRNIREFLPTGCIPASIVANLPYECVPNGIVYNELFNPLKKLDITGVVWYQGENDYLYADYYTALFDAMADVLRADFENPELPIYYVQLHRYVNSDDSTKHFVEMRECMRQMPQYIDNIYMASIIDSPDVIGQIHPIGKSILGQRLASLALYHTYGREDVVPSGPIYESHLVDGKSVKVKFSSVGTGLEIRNAETLSGFQIVDKDGNVYAATASITGKDEVTVTSEATNPVDVRYNHVPFPDPVTLYNSVGFCASSFATDVKYPINPVFTTLH